MSGVKLTEACNIAYNDLQKSKKHRYVIFLIKNEEKIDVEKVSLQIFWSFVPTQLHRFSRLGNH